MINNNGTRVRSSRRVVLTRGGNDFIGAIGEEKVESLSKRVTWPASCFERVMSLVQFFTQCNEASIDPVEA